MVGFDFWLVYVGFDFWLGAFSFFSSPDSGEDFFRYIIFWLGVGGGKDKLDDGWPESEKGTDVDVKYIEERRRCEKISEERMNI